MNRMKISLILLTFITVLSCSDDKNVTIAPGEFRGELSGAIEKKIAADAAFSISADTSKFGPHLFLRFRTGQIDIPDDDFPPIPTGVFLSVQWNEKSGVFNIGSSSFSQISFIDALTVLEAESGNILIDSFNGNVMEGTININAVNNSFSQSNNAVKITGEFIAIQEDPTTTN